MKTSNIALLFIAAIVLCFGVVKETKKIIENVNKRYEYENSINSEAAVVYPELPRDVDKMMSHTVTGTGEIALPIDYEQNYTIYEDELYVTVNEGQTWLLVPDDSDLGYARISDYSDAISASNIHLSGEKVSIVYGGRGPENISIIKTDSRGEVWSVGSISGTATHELENGYEKMSIDFIGDGQTGYLTAIRNEKATEEEILAFRSVNSGVTWDPVPAGDSLYDEIRTHFELQGIQHEY